MVRKLLDDCFLHDKDRLKHGEVLAILRERLVAVTASEVVPVSTATGRFVAIDYNAEHNVPSADNAAVDGYAFDFQSYLDNGGALRISHRITAGHPAAVPVAQGEAARIFTGALMPAGTNSVAMQEDCEVSQGEVRIPAGLKMGSNRRQAGEDVEVGTPLIRAGARIRASDAAGLAADGIGSVAVFKKLRVSIISTGDELIEAGSAAQAGRLFDANHPLLSGLLTPLPVQVSHLGIWRDNLTDVTERLSDAANNYDLLLSTGGASRGEEDHLVEALDLIGHRHLWQIAIKPGRPMCMGQINDCVFLGLPGNPVAAFVCFLLYVWPTILKMSGGEFAEPIRYIIPSGFNRPRRKMGRREFLRGWMETADDGTQSLLAFDRDGSGLISGLRQASGLIEIDEDRTTIAAGDPLPFIPFDQFGI
jgi:molybdopterin molybdotransferase